MNIKESYEQIIKHKDDNFEFERQMHKEQLAEVTRSKELENIRKEKETLKRELTGGGWKYESFKQVAEELEENTNKKDKEVNK